MAGDFSFFGEGTLQDEKVGISPQADNLFAVTSVSRIAHGSSFRVHPESDSGFRVVQGNGFEGKIGKIQPGFAGLVEKPPVSFRLDPPAEYPAELVQDFFQARGTDDVEGERAGEIHGVIQGEKERDEVGDVIGVKMGDAVKIDLAVVEAQPGHVAQAPPAPVKKDQVGGEGEGQPRGTAVGRGDAGSGAEDDEFHFNWHGGAEI